MEKLFANLPVRKFRKGQMLVYEGDPIDNIFYIQNGYIKMFHIMADGDRRIISIFAPGDMFPLLRFLTGDGIAQFFYEAMTEVELKILPQRNFQNLIKGDLDMGEKLITYAYRINLLYADRIETLSAQSARQKVLSLLEYLTRTAGVTEGGKVRLLVPLTSRDVAEMCNITRETASMQIISLRQKGVVDGRRYLLIDAKRVNRLLSQ